MWHWVKKLLEDEAPEKSGDGEPGDYDDDEPDAVGTDIYHRVRQPKDGESNKSETHLVDALRVLWDINDKKPHEAAPPDVNHDIYHVGPGTRAVPHRSSKHRQHYKKSG